MTKPVIIIGGGGHAKVLIDVLRLLKQPVLGILDNAAAFNSVSDLPVLGSDELLQSYARDEVHLVNGVGSIKPYSVRAEIFNRLKAKGYQFLTLAHPGAIIAERSEFAEGVQIMAGAVIQPDVRIAENTIINTRSSVDHDCIIGQNCHIAPGVTLSGNVTIGNHVHIGTGASIIQGITIGDGAYIAAGTVVIRDCPEKTFVKGVPGKEIVNHEALV